MKATKEKLQLFLEKNSPLIIVNTSTQAGLLCLRPLVDDLFDVLILKFDSLNGRGGNSIDIVNIEDGGDKETLYLSNEEDNILMLQKITMQNYIHYIKSSYIDALEADTEEELIRKIKEL